MAELQAFTPSQRCHLHRCAATERWSRDRGPVIHAVYYTGRRMIGREVGGSTPSKVDHGKTSLNAYWLDAANMRAPPGNAGAVRAKPGSGRRPSAVMQNRARQIGHRLDVDVAIAIARTGGSVRQQSLWLRSATS
jgi:hypothetical protein